MKKAILLIPLAFAAPAVVSAQSIGPSTINAVGNTTVIGGNEFEWSVGEMTLVSTFTNPNIVITQGVLQPAADKTGVPAVTSLQQHLRVFPNPAVSVVNMEYTSQTAGSLTYSLLDVAGKEISRQTVKVKPGLVTEQINITDLACATYMLRVTVSSGNTAEESTSYKIQKLK